MSRRRSSMTTKQNELARLVRALQGRIDRGRPRPRNDLLRLVAALWHEYQEARRSVIERLGEDTVKAGQILAVARRRGLLRLCIEQELLPAGAEEFQVSDGEAFKAHYATLAENPPTRTVMVAGGAMETNRRRH